MVRTGENKGSRVTGGKATRKHTVTTRPGAVTFKLSKRSPGRHNSAKRRPKPVWQNSIADYVQALPLSGSCISSVDASDITVKTLQDSDSESSGISVGDTDGGVSVGDTDGGVSVGDTDGASMETLHEEMNIISIEDKIEQENPNDSNAETFAIAGCSRKTGLKMKEVEFSPSHSPRSKRFLMDPEILISVDDESNKENADNSNSEIVAIAGSGPSSSHSPQRKKRLMDPEIYKHLEEMERY